MVRMKKPEDVGRGWGLRQLLQQVHRAGLQKMEPFSVVCGDPNSLILSTKPRKSVSVTSRKYFNCFWHRSKKWNLEKYVYNKWFLWEIHGKKKKVTVVIHACNPSWDQPGLQRGPCLKRTKTRGLPACLSWVLIKCVRQHTQPVAHIWTLCRR